MPALPTLRATAFFAWLAAALLSASTPIATSAQVAQVMEHSESGSGHAVLSMDEAAQEFEPDVRRPDNLDEDQVELEDALTTLHAPFGPQRVGEPSEDFVLGHQQVEPAHVTAAVGARAPPRA